MTGPQRFLSDPNEHAILSRGQQHIQLLKEWISIF
jgi:hypothetical protein